MSIPPTPNSDDLICYGCGYNLRGLSETRCPECGLEFDPLRTAIPLVPWMRRDQIGRWRAYWETIWLACRHPVRLGVELAKIESPMIDSASIFIASAKFRNLIILEAMFSTAVSVGCLLAQLNVSFHAGCRVDFVATFSLGLFIWLASSVPGVDLIESAMPRIMRQDLLCVYSCAPFAMLPAAQLAMVVLSVAGHLEYALLPPVALSVWYWLTSILILHGVHGRLRFSIAYAFVLPIAWSGMLVLTTCIFVALSQLLSPFTLH